MNVITRSFQMTYEPFWNKQPREWASPGAHNRVSAFERLVKTIKHNRRINRAIRELSDLDNDVLEDIGVERANIPELVKKMMAAEA